MKVSPATNTLLAELPESELELFTKNLELVSLLKKDDLFQIGETPKYIYYPVGAIVSMMVDLADGTATETFMLGKTCMVGIGVVGMPSFYRAHVRNSGLAYRMPSETFLHVRSNCPMYKAKADAVLNRYIKQMAQAVVCSKRHSTELQLIRWMMIALDRMTDTTIEITHKELADILGLRRESITLNLTKMSDRGEILVKRGAIEVQNRQALEARSCACYWISQERKHPLFNV
jgi:CRP-like cAMP-binding protein